MSRKELIDAIVKEYKEDMSEESKQKFIANLGLDFMSDEFLESHLAYMRKTLVDVEFLDS